MSINSSSLIPSNGSLVSQTAASNGSAASSSASTHGSDLSQSFIHDFLAAIEDKIETLFDGGQQDASGVSNNTLPVSNNSLPISNNSTQPTDAQTVSGSDGQNEQTGLDYWFYHTDKGPGSLDMSATETWENSPDGNTVSLHFSLLLNLSNPTDTTTDTSGGTDPTSTTTNPSDGTNPTDPLDISSGKLPTSSTSTTSGGTTPSFNAFDPSSGTKSSAATTHASNSSKSSSPVHASSQSNTKSAGSSDIHSVLAQFSGIQDLLDRYKAISGS